MSKTQQVPEIVESMTDAQAQEYLEVLADQDAQNYEDSRESFEVRCVW